MGYVVDINKLDDIPAFSPPHHTKTTDRKIIDETTGAKNLALWHAEIEPGGVAELHVHEEMEQAFIVLGGKGSFMVEDQEYTATLFHGGLAETRLWIASRKQPCGSAY